MDNSLVRYVILRHVPRKLSAETLQLADIDIHPFDPELPAMVESNIESDE